MLGLWTLSWGLVTFLSLVTLFSPLYVVNPGLWCVSKGTLFGQISPFLRLSNYNTCFFVGKDNHILGLLVKVPISLLQPGFRSFCTGYGFIAGFSSPDYDFVALSMDFLARDMDFPALSMDFLALSMDFLALSMDFLALSMDFLTIKENWISSIDCVI